MLRVVSRASNDHDKVFQPAKLPASQQNCTDRRAHECSATAQIVTSRSMLRPQGIAPPSTQRCSFGPKRTYRLTCAAAGSERKGWWPFRHAEPETEIVYVTDTAEADEVIEDEADQTDVALQSQQQQQLYHRAAAGVLDTTAAAAPGDAEAPTANHEQQAVEDQQVLQLYFLL